MLFDRIYDHVDYRGAVELLLPTLRQHAPDARRLLDVACGSGRHLEYLAESFDVEGLDLDEALLAMAATRVDNSRFHHGDMRSFNLGATFDVITCLHYSIAYVETVEGLVAAFEHFARHLNPGGIAAIEPWVDESRLYEPRPVTNAIDLDSDSPLIRMYTPRRVGAVVVHDVHLLLSLIHI